MKDIKVSNSESGTRWWEFYFVRYAMGTVVGAAIVYYLFKNNTSLSTNLLFPQDAKLDVAYLVLLGIYGLTYCYISSAPILVLHAIRYQFESDKVEWWKRARKHLFLLAALGVVSTTITKAILYENSSTSYVVVQALILLLLLYIIIPLYYFTIKCLLKPDGVYEFYKRLSENRVKGSKDFIESYKHLREHGNSFSIVLCELLLGFILLMGGKSDSVFMQSIEFKNELIIVYAGVIFVWTLPAALVWMIATSIERKLVDEQK